MTEHSAVEGVVELLSAPDLLSQAASSPAVRTSLQGMLDQVTEEIAMLTLLLPPVAAADSRTLGQSLRGRQMIAARLRDILESSHSVSA
jgi:hypothetical protein